MEPAAEVAGDFYDAFFLDERRLFFAVGDVAGKVMAAALFMARSLALLRAEALRRRPLHEMLARVNEVLARGNEQATFVALTCGVLDTTNGAIRLVNGGGGAPFVRTGKGWSRFPMPRGIVIGVIPGFVFETARARLGLGDALLLFSDGVTEARSVGGELFGIERLERLLTEHVDADAAGLVRAVRRAVDEFSGGGPPADDLTLFVVRRSDLPAAPPAERYEE
jgi:serine phosphatase RsbU (regulator of sigma subunit)